MSVGSLKFGAIDVHAHLTPREFPPNEAAETRWPCMQNKSATAATILMGDKPFRSLDHRSWDLDRRIQDMDQAEVAVQVLSPMPELLAYWFDAKNAERLCDFINMDLANQVGRRPSRFLGLGAIPMQDTGLAIRHLQRIKTVYGLSGVEIGSNVNGEMLGADRFLPIFEAARDLDLAVFVHALHPVATRTISDPTVFSPLVGFPLDVAMAAASLLLAHTLEKTPGLRIGFSHGGGALQPVLHRLDFAWSNGSLGDKASSQRPSEVAARMFFDSNVYSAEYLSHIVRCLSPGRVFLGTDYPYQLMQPQPIRYVESAGLSVLDAQSVLWNAAYEFLRVEPPQ
jgi:aminocarboxymuconate-semialdehyde decarboxylase